MTGARFPRGALFDLDGTLLDSAPDMLATVNRMRATRGLAALPLEAIRPHVSRGARAMSAAAFGEGGLPVDDAVVAEFLAVYAEELGRHSVLFEGVDAMLAALEADGVRWGVVTNKPEYLAARIIPQLGWASRCAVLVGGDTLTERKPHPLPLLHAAAAIGLAPAQCVYVGDDARDIQAAQAAGMPSVAALWGYRLAGDDPASWQADTMVAAASELCDPRCWPPTG